MPKQQRVFPTFTLGWEKATIMASNSEKPAQESFPFFSLPNNQNQSGFGFLFGSNEKPLPPPPPSVEVLTSEMSPTVKYTVESVNLGDGLTLLKGRVSTHEVFALSNSDLVPGKYEGGLKLWEGSLDLVKALHSEIQGGQLSLKGKHVLELGCGHGLPGIFSCLEGASVVHFQDFNAEVLRCLTIPNVNANTLRGPQQLYLATNETEKTQAEVRFFAGDWSEIHKLLFHVCDKDYQKGSDSSSGQDPPAGYDVILMAETVYSISSLQNLYGLIKKCLSWPHGVVYMAGKKHYFGVGGGTRQFLSVVEKDGLMEASLIAEVADGLSNLREVWKISFK
ncbi:PREDICTED: histidine protein methyltransferase 1 homolog isoform X2 [Nelumbo nucifera]|uniref:protein-histidine N-methyltransferase n=2 Tax=Nelumbo nucifera TaxID=4432 RepID=A0A1U8AAC7_NELNU|nr:PREDICTED: histidine protein methyltransferase 1 homolog isoform X2 [Nelumbo nucifera]